MTETLAYDMGTHMTALRESFPMNTKISGFIWFFKNILHFSAKDESSLSMDMVKTNPAVGTNLLNKSWLYS